MNKMTQEGIQLIKSFEGCILSAYDDYNDHILRPGERCKGVITIGWGITPMDGINIYPGMTITQQEADDMFINHLQRYIRDVESLGIEFTDNEFSALVSFHYNTGSVRTLCANRNKQQIADAMLMYNKASGRILEGLVRRRKAEREMFLNGTSCSVADMNSSYDANDLTPNRNFVGNRCGELQELLVKLGYDLEIDAIYGNHTHKCLGDAQLRLGLYPDYMCGEQTFAKLHEAVNNGIKLVNNEPEQPQPTIAPESQVEQPIDTRVEDIQRVCNNMGISCSIDNIWGCQSHEAVSKLPLCRKGDRNCLVGYIQARVGAEVDEIFGNDTEFRVKVFQREHGLSDDGIVGFDTLTEMILH